MTLTINLSAEAESKLTIRADQAGIPVNELITEILEDIARADQPSLLDEMTALGVIGAVAGSSGPGDGRAWSDVEAACNPLEYVYTPTAQELASIDEGIRSMENEPTVTFDEALRRARIRHQAWLNADVSEPTE
jgi:hypothetical protein